MKKQSLLESAGLPLGVMLVMLALWWGVWRAGMFHASALPSPPAVLSAFQDEIRSGQMFTDLVTSLYRVSIGFVLSVVTGVPLGLWMGQKASARLAFLPIINFFRNLSPLAWIPFAILWFGVGDAPSIFLIYMSAVFPIILATMAAVANIPSVYSRVAQTFDMNSREKLFQVTLPAILPQVITALRVTAGVSWLVVVAAEMIAGRDGLGFAVMDSRNGLRTDILVAEMIVIGVVGVGIDRALVQLTRLPSVRWGYER